MHGKYLRVVLLLLVISVTTIFCSFKIGDTSLLVPKGNSYSEKGKNSVKTSAEPTSNSKLRTGQDIILTLARNSELEDMKDSIISFERSFNSKFHYDWWFMNDEEFDQEFKSVVKSLVSGDVKFIKIPKEYWSYPEHIDQKKAASSRNEYEKKKVMYGKSESYRFMCRFNSGMFYKLPELEGVDYYWRIEPAVRFDCDITYDVFQYMRENDKQYAFSMALQEDIRTIPSLWDVTKEFFKDNPELIAPGNSIDFVTDDRGVSYNLCHFWSNFEIASLEFFRESGYDEYFKFLDERGGFFYERWGDAPVHTIAVSVLLPAEKIHFVGNTGYFHNPNQDCPRNSELRSSLKCRCDPSTDFTWHKWSCVNKFFEIHNYVRPDSLDNIKKYYPTIYETIDLHESKDT